MRSILEFLDSIFRVLLQTLYLIFFCITWLFSVIIIYMYIFFQFYYNSCFPLYYFGAYVICKYFYVICKYFLTSF